MDDLALASRVRAELALDAATSHLEFEVTASDGVVRIHGATTEMREVVDIQRVALGVPGVLNLNLDELVSRVHA